MDSLENQLYNFNVQYTGSRNTFTLCELTKQCNVDVVRVGYWVKCYYASGSPIPLLSPIVRAVRTPAITPKHGRELTHGQ